MNSAAEKALRQVLGEYSEILFGFTGISYGPYAGQYQSALVLAVPYGEQLTLRKRL